MQSQLIVVCTLRTILVVGWVSLGMSAEQRQAPIHQYTGKSNPSRSIHVRSSRGCGFNAGIISCSSMSWGVGN
jgi:hypothetical protein